MSDNLILESLLNMDIHTTFKHSGYLITRVPGGWLYFRHIESANGVSAVSTFVPMVK